MDISAYQHMNIRMSTRGKRPLRNLTPNDKVRAIQRIHNGETKASVSRDIGVPESTLRGWCKNEQKLRFMCRQLGSDNLGLASLDTPPEKRAKFELQLLPPKFATIPSYDDLGIGGLPCQAMAYTTHNEALLEKFALVEFIKHKSLHPEAIQQITDAHAASKDSVSSVPGYSTNNMVHQLNLLALFNSKLSPKVNFTEPSSIPNPKPDCTTTLEEAKKFNSPLLSVKNWAKDPAKHSPSPTQTQYINDNNNNDIDCAFTPTTTTTTATATPIVSSNSTNNNNNSQPALPSMLQPIFEAQPSQAAVNSTQIPMAEGDGQGQGALLDWCKMFSASLNFFAFAAAAAASMHPTVEGHGLPGAMEPGASGANDLLKRLSPSVHSESSKESFYDSEPEDLSVRSCASKVSSPANSRSHSPDKSSTASTSVHSDAEQ
ncbi:protein distal antenna-related [Drosophila mojavensis]|uniref:HTH psq-type domain-containing protein n=1 Tax=Drosophila mojavensis TaxID=7230 RepID=B4KCB4_DROMO|nr:protein distal antenna-related [Drosophila mojavensis]EDW13723.1 uncharacterized protein Dmoj_GI23730 [Drosophila mojavensis]